MPDVTALAATDLLAAYRARTLSPVEVAEATLARIARHDGAINAFVTVTADRALADARRAEVAFARGGRPGAIEGVPFTLKDLAVSKGIRTGRGSLVWCEESPTFDAPVAERLAAAGGVLLGKTTTPELGWKGDAGNRLNGPCHNPWRHGRTAGGSSGGTAAAAAAGFGALHQGSDGAGSVRIPASFCGVPGLKPTYGLVPQFPPSAVETVSHVGPIARTVADVALMTDVMAGVDPRDRTSVDPVGGPFLAALGTPLAPLRVAFSPDLGYARVEAGVAQLVAEAVAVFRDLGHVVDDVDLDLVDPWPIEEAIWDTAMAAMHRDRLDEVRDLLDPGLLAVIETGLGRTGAELARAYQARTRWVEGLRRQLEPYDLLLCPTLPCTAFAAGDDHPGTVAGAPVSYLGWTTFTYPFNLTGQPAATVPCGLLDGLPVGLQVVGPRFSDALVLRAAAAFERARPFASPSL